jgi:creatinine amidohydrolase
VLRRKGRIATQPVPGKTLGVKRTTDGSPSTLLDELGHDVDHGELRGRVALLPTGSVEYHGPHAPLGTDLFIARALAERIGARRPRLVVLPELAYAPCRAETRRHPGTIAIPASVALTLLEQLFRSLFATGFAGVVVLNAHVENVAPAGLAADAVSDDFPEAFVAVVNWWETLPAQEVGALAGFTDNGGHGHGGPLELSVTQAIVPELVRPELAADVEERPGPRSGALRLVAPPHARIPPRGYHGRASEIDRDHGKQLLDLATERIVASIDALLEYVDGH